MRIYDPDTQRSQNEVKSFVIGTVKSHGEEVFGFLEYCKDFSLINVNPHEIDQHLVRFYERSLILEKIQETLPLSCEILNEPRHYKVIRFQFRSIFENASTTSSSSYRKTKIGKLMASTRALISALEQLCSLNGLEVTG